MSRRYRIVIVAVLALAAVGGYWKLDVAPKRVEAAELEQKVLTQQAQLAQTQALIQTYEGARAAYKDNYSTVVGLGKAIPSDDDTRSLLVQLDATARRSGVDFDSVNVNGSGGGAADGEGGAVLAPGAINAGSFSAMPFSLSFSGDFGTLGNFLARLERFVSLKGEAIAVSGRLMRVESIQLAPSEGGWPGLSAQIGASSYIVPETQAVADGAAASGATANATSAPAAGTTTTTAASGTGSDIR